LKAFRVKYFSLFLGLGFIAPLGFWVFAEDQPIKVFRTEERLVHPSGVFSIVPPKGYRQTLLSQDGVQFINLVDKSFMSISFTDVATNLSDEELFSRFSDTAFRKGFISNLQTASSALHTKVTSTIMRKVADIEAIEFVSEGVSEKGVVQRTDFIIFYKGKKEFVIILTADKELFAMDMPFFEEALATFKLGSDSGLLPTSAQ